MTVADAQVRLFALVGETEWRRLHNIPAWRLAPRHRPWALPCEGRTNAGPCLNWSRDGQRLCYWHAREAAVRLEAFLKPMPRLCALCNGPCPAGAKYCGCHRAVRRTSADSGHCVPAVPIAVVSRVTDGCVHVLKSTIDKRAVGYMNRAGYSFLRQRSSRRYEGFTVGGCD